MLKVLIRQFNLINNDKGRHRGYTRKVHAPMLLWICRLQHHFKKWWDLSCTDLFLPSVIDICLTSYLCCLLIVLSSKCFLSELLTSSHTENRYSHHLGYVKNKVGLPHDAQHGKKALSHIQTVKVQMSLRICAIWSGHSLFIVIYYSSHWFFKWVTQALISLRKYTGWSRPVLPTKCIRAHFMHYASHVNSISPDKKKMCFLFVCFCCCCCYLLLFFFQSLMWLDILSGEATRSPTFFRGDWSWNIFYGHSLPSADSRAVVSFWRKNVHNTG